MNQLVYWQLTEIFYLQFKLNFKLLVSNLKLEIFTLTFI